MGEPRQQESRTYGKPGKRSAPIEFPCMPQQKTGVNKEEYPE
jgi:hypothetical protein